MKRTMLLFRKQVFIVAIAITLLGLAACTSTNTSTESSDKAPDGQNNLALLQQNGNVSVRFYGVVTFDNPGTTFSFPSEFTVSSVPIEWMDRIFSGKLKEGGPGQDVTDQVHGSVSTDGAWLDSLSFSRQIIRPTLNTGLLYRVTLRNLPIGKVIDRQATELVVFEKSGAELQKYIAEIKYADGPLKGGQIVPVTTYLSTDWKNTNSGQMPTLKLTFAKGSGDPAFPAANPGAGMMR